MKASQIEVGKTYRNRGAGRTLRKVLAIGDQHRPEWCGDPITKPIGEPGVLFEQLGGQRAGKTATLYLSSFAAWAGAEAEQ